MELTSQIFDLDSKQATNLFVRGLVKGSLLHERFLENPPYDLSELKSRAEGIIGAEEGKQKIAKKHSDCRFTKQFKIQRDTTTKKGFLEG